MTVLTQQETKTHEVSVRVIEAAIGLCRTDRLSAEQWIARGCLMPSCLTATTVLLVAYEAGIAPSFLLGEWA